MKGEGYKTAANDERTYFTFTSIGTKGTIPKVVEYMRFDHKIWNLAFGDANELDFDDAVVSDNRDARKVIQTIVNTVYAFFEKHPGQEIYIEPVDDRRKKLYNFIFSHRREEIITNFHVEGMLEGKRELYSSENFCDAFFVSQKERTFED